MVIHRIHKSGGSFAVVIPKSYLDRLNITSHDYVMITLKDHCIDIRPLRKYPKPKKRKGRR